jgi:iron-sulfur cluster insertion protein
MDTETASKDITLSASAARRIGELTAAESEAGKFLRVSVSGGGCSGFMLGFELDDTLAEDDRVIERDGERAVVDEMSWGYLGGGEIDFVAELIGSCFTVRNPNATATCGCGVSFAVG